MAGVPGKGGPKTEAGKRRVRKNAVKHGMLAATIVVISTERVDVWRKHLASVFADLEPVGYIEQILAERVALLLWRLARVIRYESGNIESANDALQPFTLTSDVTAVSGAESTVLNTIHKYEAHLSREFGRTMRELEYARIARKSQGETNIAEGNTWSLDRPHYRV